MKTLQEVETQINSLEQLKNQMKENTNFRTDSATWEKQWRKYEKLTKQIDSLQVARLKLKMGRGK